MLTSFSWNVTTRSTLFSQIRCIFIFIHVLEGFFVKDFLRTSSEIVFKHFSVTWMWSITWRRWSFRLPRLNVGQFSYTSFLKLLVMGGKRKELIPPHCLQIKYLYFTLTVSIRDFLSLPTERNENSIRCWFIVKLNVNKYRCTCEEMTSTTMELWQKARQKLADLAWNFESAVYLLICLLLLLHRWNTGYIGETPNSIYIFFLLPVEFSRIPKEFRRDNEWCYRR